MALNSLEKRYVSNLTQFPGKNGMGCGRGILKALNPLLMFKEVETQILSRVTDWAHRCSKQLSYPGLPRAPRNSGSGSEGQKHCRSLLTVAEFESLYDPGDVYRLTWVANKDVIFFQDRVLLVDSLAPQYSLYTGSSLGLLVGVLTLDASLMENTFSASELILDEFVNSTPVIHGHNFLTPKVLFALIYSGITQCDPNIISMHRRIQGIGKLVCLLLLLTVPHS